MMDRAQIIERVKDDRGNPMVDGLKTWLAQKETTLVSTREAKVRVAEARRLWTVRLKNTDITGQELQGAERFLSRLSEFAPQRQLEQFAFKSPERLGNLFFLGSDHTFVGAITVTREPARRNRGESVS